MKVKELIAKLQEMDQEVDILLWEDTDSSGGWKELKDAYFADTSSGFRFVCLD